MRRCPANEHSSHDPTADGCLAFDPEDRRLPRLRRRWRDRATRLRRMDWFHERRTALPGDGDTSELCAFDNDYS
jgi:hypothetical protein